MRDRLLHPVIGFCRWLAGSPPRKPPSAVKTWLFRLLYVTSLGLIGWFLLLGPGVVLMPFVPRGYQSVADSTNAIYYESGEESAREVLRLAREAQDTILDFWGERSGNDRFKGIKIYLGETPQAYYRLTMNRAGGSAMFGNVIVIDMSKAGQTLSLVDFMNHEMGHIYMRRRLGYVRKHLTVPAWFDEGCSVLVQGGSPDVASLGDYLKKRPRLLSVTALRYHTDWEAMVSMEGGRLARQHYGYVGAFVDYLHRRFGIEAIRKYLSALSWRADPEEVFATVYGSTLAEVEQQFLSEYRAMKGIEEGIAIIEPPLVPRVVIRWTLILGLLAFAMLWSIRQALRLSRFALGRYGLPPWS